MSTAVESSDRPERGVEQLPDDVKAFIQRLEDLSTRGDLATLRRNAGNTLAQASSAMGPFYRMLPSEAYWEEEIYFLVATLYPLNPYKQKGDFGSTVAALRSAVDLKTLDRRMAILLDSDFDSVDDKVGGGSLSYRLRQFVKFAASKQVGVDWGRLLADLRYWTHPEKRVQKRWARSYYQGTRPHAKEGGAR
ncbi:MAG: type I-E CRISPR-associated protein Cse2/CasB [Thermaerobacter sp.]|nr:type I-E CRISPR-associated protein Cse2/CasB [Thermaerobacter sp.]